MRTIRSDDPDAPKAAAEVLRGGGVILYPTDTLYGLGADALSEAAIAKVYRIKQRDTRMPLHAIVESLAIAGKYGEVNSAARLLAEKFLPGPLTIVLRKRVDADPAMSKGRDEWAFRIPCDSFCLELAGMCGAPYTTTSANLSGLPSGRSVEEICAQLGEGVRDIDLVIDAGEIPERPASTIVNVKTGVITIEREGAIASEDILRCAASRES